MNSVSTESSSMLLVGVAVIVLSSLLSVLPVDGENLEPDAAPSRRLQLTTACTTSPPARPIAGASPRL